MIVAKVLVWSNASPLSAEAFKMISDVIEFSPEFQNELRTGYKRGLFKLRSVSWSIYFAFCVSKLFVMITFRTLLYSGKYFELVTIF